MQQADFTTLWTVLGWIMHVLGVAIPSAALAGALLFALFKWSGQKWVERLLNRDLEQFKREQQEKLEGFKGEQQKELERLACTMRAKHHAGILFNQSTRVDRGDEDVGIRGYLLSLYLGIGTR